MNVALQRHYQNLLESTQNLPLLGLFYSPWVIPSMHMAGTSPDAGVHKVKTFISSCEEDKNALAS